MRQQTDSIHARKTTAIVPAAIAGSIALALSAPSGAAAAVERSTDHHADRSPASPARGLATAVAVRPAAGVPASYTVQKGDTVWGVASRYGLRTADVLVLNGLSASSIIRPGQVLRLSGAAAAPATPAAPAVPAATYTVQNGDTLTSIARRHGISVQSLFAATGLGWSSIIYPGQKISLGGTAVPAVPAAPVAPAAPDPPAANADGGTTHTVANGDTLGRIAARHGTTVQALFALNGLGWSSIIYPGQTVVVKAPPAPPAPAAPAQAPVPQLNSEQTANAQLIIRIGREIGVPERGIAIALGAAMQESSLRNLNRGDRDSKGLFQQRPSAGWGTEADITDPVRATRAFYGGPADPNGATTRGLLDIPGWQGMTFTQAAQAVQISAYPDHYAKWELSASTWLATLG